MLMVVLSLNLNAQSISDLSSHMTMDIVAINESLTALGYIKIETVEFIEGEGVNGFWNNTSAGTELQKSNTQISYSVTKEIYTQAVLYTQQNNLSSTENPNPFKANNKNVQSVFQLNGYVLYLTEIPTSDTIKYNILVSKQ